MIQTLEQERHKMKEDDEENERKHIKDNSINSIGMGMGILDERSTDEPEIPDLNNNNNNNNKNNSNYTTLNQVINQNSTKSTSPSPSPYVTYNHQYLRRKMNQQGKKMTLTELIELERRQIEQEEIDALARTQENKSQITLVRQIYQSSKMTKKLYELSQKFEYNVASPSPRLATLKQLQKVIGEI
ncbi:MAG: hypothetical protein EZS28_022492 [Streblomastix strix]|uniref:Uncharacterized protein n=1 Tax=Streblomastix strix TaxID=222440 RepID=A0A5J4VHD6_9EUKA|nr:MAG: hypothetical protein EZS28_022492 [Streblomastix strix]